ncbi:MAG: hypothetical protein RIS47_856, partial [Bacteroidota bacterium]
QDAVNQRPDIAIFSAGGDTSLEWAPKFAAAGTFVVDNSSAWRMHPDHKLVVPEINANILTKDDKIIANPNCSTIQMVLALAPLHKKYGVKRVVVSTYQSITGTGVKAVAQMENERNGVEGAMAYPYQIDRNAIPHCDVFIENGYTKEEMKLTNEPKKILQDDSIQVVATAVRIPVVGGHSEAINVEFHNDFDEAEVRALLAATPGIIVQDNTAKNEYPMPFYSKNKNEVFVGRIRRDFTQANTLNMWVVADNLRKGAATNAIQIAEYLMSVGLV